MNILSEILAHKCVELADWKRACPLDMLREKAAALAKPTPFAAALRAAPMGLIAEAKRKSPSAGAIREPFDPAAIASAYARAGAQAISVLMDRKYFAGGETDFRAVRAAVALPLLYKEFVVDPWQVWHARVLGASAVLLIAAALSDRDLAGLLRECREAGLETLVEVHEESEMESALAAGAVCLGVNNRDLKTFAVDLATTERLKPLAPAGCTLISESGIRSAADVARLKAAGVHGVLVGEHLLRQANLEQAVRDLMSKVW
ncbi:MAG: indole-3-glycerol phosphate synthase TrpC [Verrucomicrobia bacterium]|nr:indole-3-glycerol phosphate synthase TrpC [Verrucomicrobiota bacterium]